MVLYILDLSAKVLVSRQDTIRPKWAVKKIHFKLFYTIIILTVHVYDDQG